jgi:hypothetical protein
VARPQVRRAELDGARDEPVGAHDRRHPLLHQAVAQGHEHVDEIAFPQRRQHVGDVGCLERDQPEVEAPGQLVDRRVRIEHDDALLAQDVDPQPGPRRRSTCSWLASSATTRATLPVISPLSLPPRLSR